MRGKKTGPKIPGRVMGGNNRNTNGVGCWWVWWFPAIPRFLLFFGGFFGVGFVGFWVWCVGLLTRVFVFLEIWFLCLGGCMIWV